MIKYEVIPSVKYAVTLLGYNVGNASYPMKTLSDEEKTSFEKEIRENGWPFGQV